MTSDQFNHFVSTTTLANAQRGWMGMTTGETKRQFHWYLEEYTGSRLSATHWFTVTTGLAARRYLWWQTF
ncbi:hypothetical protein GQ600_27145 [Phytophthora cactorum]|nr:hypothetical protein GQ600_27145 [Phytophthora cactorum]